MSQKRIERGFEAAKKASMNSTFKQHHLGSAIMYKGSILAVGYNMNKTSPVQKRLNFARGFDIEASGMNHTLHSETVVLGKIKALDVDFSKMELFVYRQHKDGKRAIARPCPACMQLIKEMGIKNIYYTTYDGYAHEVIEYD